MERGYGGALARLREAPSGIQARLRLDSNPTAVVALRDGPLEISTPHERAQRNAARDRINQIVAAALCRRRGAVRCGHGFGVALTLRVAFLR